MSKHLSLVLLGTSCMCLTALHAQNWVNGGNTLAADGRLGTNNAYALVFETNNSERGRITNGGIWSIGTTPKTAKFTVNSAAGQSSLRVMVAEATKLIVNSNGGTTIGGSTTVGPANGLYVSGSVGIGTATPAYKLHVEGTVYGKSSNSMGVFGYSSYSNGEGVHGQSPYIGVYGYAGGYGLYGVAYNAGGYGVYGVNSSGATSSGIGVYGSSSWIGVDGRGNLFGVRGNVTGASAYAVGGISSQSVGVYGYTGNASSYAGLFIGKVNATGGYSGPSDRKLKEDIVDVSNAMDIISKLQPKSYKFRQDGNFKLMNLPQGKHFGLIAQDVEQVLPELVAAAEFNTARVPKEIKEGTAGTPQQPLQEDKGEIINFKGLNYTELIPIMIKAMQEQQQVINEQKELLQQQQLQIDELKEWMYKLNGGQNLTTFLSSAKLGEASPNPVKGTAIIQYTIPEGSYRPHLLITDALGRQIKALQLSASGTVNIDVSTLASGVYNYSLIVNNKTIATKKMTVAR